MSKFVQAALSGQDITIYGDGSQTRTFCYVQDNVDSCYNALVKNKFVNDVVNIGAASETTILELAQLVIKACKSDSKIVHLPALTEGDMQRRKPDTSRMQTLLNRPTTSLKEGMRQVVEATKNI